MSSISSKGIRVLLLISAMCLLSACEIIKQVTQQHESNAQIVNEDVLCLTPSQLSRFDEFCTSSFWLEYMLTTHALPWSERLKIIVELDESPSSLIKKVLLSQGTDTPYQHRLRAQNWIANIKEDASVTMKIIVEDMIYENSKQLLEFESAITILSSINARQEKIISELTSKLTELDQEIQKQQDQVEQLLKIETDLIQQNRNEKR